ncbi:TetR/AcrR family transcriptional regulator [Leptospira perolatii]|uniref:TetR/AcrR family transcriptional regulator n=1 Tax=Leptospira perolatii TaxID=2023191 RepID=UPI0024345A2A|nr:TetR/AcrR family transcriptional regulator [Leptospira perolatii]
MPAILASKGFSGMTLDDVALVSKTGKAAIYRRWKGKSELVVDAIRMAFQQTNPKAPNTGDPIKDLCILLGNTANMLENSFAGKAIRRLVSELPSQPQLKRLVRELDTERRSLLIEILDRGNLRNDSETISMLLGPIYFRFLITGEKISEEFIFQIVNRVSSPANSLTAGA